MELPGGVKDLCPQVQIHYDEQVHGSLIWGFGCKAGSVSSTSGCHQMPLQAHVSHLC